MSDVEPPSGDTEGRCAVAEEVDTLASAVGKVLRERRVELGLPLRTVGERTGLSVSILSRLEQAKRPLTVSRLANLCDALDASPLDVVRQAQQRTAASGGEIREGC
jgi:transcriptional regulator with XRE-family HTH domain